MSDRSSRGDRGVSLLPYFDSAAMAECNHHKLSHYAVKNALDRRRTVGYASQIGKTRLLRERYGRPHFMGFGGNRW